MLMHILNHVKVRLGHTVSCEPVQFQILVKCKPWLTFITANDCANTLLRGNTRNLVQGELMQEMYMYFDDCIVHCGL